MKTLIIYSSKHHDNTKKIGDAIAEVLNADVINAKEKDISDESILKDYDLIGFGSGIYFGKFDKKILEFIDGLPIHQNKKAFIFSTNSRGEASYNELLTDVLKVKGFEVLGNFACKGFNNFGPFKLIGGVAKGRPNDDDIKDAKTFAENLIK